MENYRQHTEGILLCGNGWGGYGKNSVWPGHFRFPYKETADGWHYYGVDWSEDGYSFYADGVLIGMQTVSYTHLAGQAAFLSSVSFPPKETLPRLICSIKSPFHKIHTKRPLNM